VVLVPLIATIRWPPSMERADYVSQFYVAGRLVADGRASDLYPDQFLTARLSTSPVNTLAHELLPGLPPATTVTYLYSPLVAWVFAPLSRLGPAVSMLVWQLISLGALAACVLLVAVVSGQRPSDALWMSLLFFPVFHMLLIGQLGITLGLLPLCAGYYWVIRGKPFLAGLAWSCLMLKPHFAPTALLMVGTLVLRGRPRCLLGCLSGVAVLVALSAYLAPGMSSRWMAAMRFDDVVLSEGRYAYPVHLVTSLPAVALPLLPVHLRHGVLMIGYGLGALIGLHALWRSHQLMRASTSDPMASLPMIFLLGIGVLPVVAPHLLFYDLSILAMAGIVMTAPQWSEPEALRLRWLAWTYVLSTNAYLVLFMFISVRLATPFLLVAVLVFVYTQLLGLARGPLSRTSSPPDGSR